MSTDQKYQDKMYEVLYTCKTALGFALIDLEEFEESGTQINKIIENIQYALNDAKKLKHLWNHDKMHTCACCGQSK